MIQSTRQSRAIPLRRSAAVVHTVLPPLLAVVICVMVGCQDADQPEIGEVYGQVTLDGDPLPNARVQFQPEGGGRPSSGETDKNGRYELRFTRDRNGALLGKHRVRITTKDTVDGREIPEKVPTRYNLEADGNPEMLREVEPGGNEINFKLTTGAKGASGT